MKWNADLSRHAVDITGIKTMTAFGMIKNKTARLQKARRIFRRPVV